MWRGIFARRGEGLISAGVVGEPAMQDWNREAERFVEGHVHAWLQSRFAPLAKVVRKNRKELTGLIKEVFERDGKCFREKSDEARSLTVRFALERARVELDVEHFILFKEAETVQLILEDAFGMSPGKEEDRVTIPYQEEAVRSIVRCLFRGSMGPADAKDVAAFMGLFSSRGNADAGDQDRVMRIKSMVWLAYLLIDLVRTEKDRACTAGAGYLRSMLQTLMDKAVEGKIINEETAAPQYNYGGGKWDSTLFGWLQGEDRKSLVEKLRRQLNLENRIDHANRMLLAGHRECMYRQVLSLFC